MYFGEEQFHVLEFETVRKQKVMGYDRARIGEKCGYIGIYISVFGQRILIIYNRAHFSSIQQKTIPLLPLFQHFYFPTPIPYTFIYSIPTKPIFKFHNSIFLFHFLPFLPLKHFPTYPYPIPLHPLIPLTHSSTHLPIETKHTPILFLPISISTTENTPFNTLSIPFSFTKTFYLHTYTIPLTYS